MIGLIIRGMILNINLMQNYSENSVTANSSLLSPTGSVKRKPPETENSKQYGYDENDNNNKSNETKRETNYSTSKWIDVNTHNYMQLTKYNKYTNDDVHNRRLRGAHDTLSSHIARTLVHLVMSSHISLAQDLSLVIYHPHSHP